MDNNQTPDAVREATQEDREAAWPFRADCYGHLDKNGWMNGKYDHNRVIQAFVSHRLAILAALDSRAGDAQSISIAIGAGPARSALLDLEQFLTDHSGNEDTTEGMEAEDRAHKAMRFVRRVIRAAMDLCDGATDDCTIGRFVTVDGDDFDQLNAALDAVAPAVDAAQIKEPI